MGADMNNPPAFPLHNHGAQTLGLHVTGMSLRDYFAAKAMQGYCSNQQHTSSCTVGLTADCAYEMADAMLKARDGTG
jgi:hypothetical protein